MINKKTVLILGAGASVPYRYPTGHKLKILVTNQLDTKQEGRYFSQLVRLKYDPPMIQQFRLDLFRSGKSSVDLFLEHRPEYVEIGKVAMAQVLIEREDEAILFKNGDWYEYLNGALHTSFDDFDQNNISIITFNYDRSLEHFLFTSLRSSYGKSDEECASKLERIPILHLYGQLGYLPWQGKDTSRVYKPCLSDTENDVEVREAASQIRIIHDTFTASEDERFQKAHELIQDADRVLFLGFGYHTANIFRLNLDAVRENMSYYGTAYHLQTAQQTAVKRLFPVEKRVALGEIDDDILLFLKKKIVW